MGTSRSKDAFAGTSAALSINPISSAAGTVNGSAVDRMAGGGNVGYMSAKVVVQGGAASGTPSAQSITSTLQDSADGSTGWADVTDADGNAIGELAVISADDGISSLNVDLSRAKRYLRVESVIAFTGGTSPEVVHSACIVLGGPLSA